MKIKLALAFMFTVAVAAAPVSAQDPANETQFWLDELEDVGQTLGILQLKTDEIESELQQILDAGHAPEPPDPDPIPPEPDPEPPVEGVPAAIAAMPPGSWLPYGESWDEAAPDPLVCGKGFKTVLGAWNGWTRDHLGNIHVAASGGHRDGCDNGVYRYNIQTGTVELLVPHEELNSALDTNKPYVALVPDGKQILPRSKHTNYGQQLVGDWHYQIGGAVWRSGTSDGQFWRFNVKELRWERLTNYDSAIPESVVYLFSTPFGLVAAGKLRMCDVDVNEGQYNEEGILSATFTCQNTQHNFNVKLGVAWDPLREGIWMVNPKNASVKFIKRVDGIWTIDESLSGAIPSSVNDGLASLPGVCVVPEVTGSSILILSATSSLYKWDGGTWTTIDAPGGPPDASSRRIASKWSWDDTAEVCIGGTSVDAGLWIYKPSSSRAPEVPVDPDPPVDPEPPVDPDPEPPVGEGSGLDLRIKWHIDPNSLPSIAGQEIRPAAWDPVSWDQPIERLPGAPDYDTICAGLWADLDYRTDAHLAGSKPQIEGLIKNGISNVRIHLHPLKNEVGNIVAYTQSIKAPIQCLEVIGIPSQNGEKPQMAGNIKLDHGRGLIVRGILMAETGGECIVAKGPSSQQTMPDFVVLNNNEFYACGGHVHIFGAGADRHEGPYLQMLGNTHAYGQSGGHVSYIERSVGRFVYKSNICFAPGWGHCLKNLAHQSLIEGNVLSNAGLDGLPTMSPKGRTYTGGMHVLDLYGCNETVVLNNTLIFRTTTNKRQFVAYRNRRAWGGCKKGRRLPNSPYREIVPTQSLEFYDSAFWAEVKEARKLFSQGYVAAQKSDLLFTHLVRGNRLFLIEAFKNKGAVFASLNSIRSNVIDSARGVFEEEVRGKEGEGGERLGGLANSCSGNHECFYNGASELVQYAYDHMTVAAKKDMVEQGRLISKIPTFVPADWAERYAVFWGSQEGWRCDGDGTNCTTWDVPIPVVPVGSWAYDQVKQSSPPLVIVEDQG